MGEFIGRLLPQGTSKPHLGLFCVVGQTRGGVLEQQVQLLFQGKQNRHDKLMKDPSHQALLQCLLMMLHSTRWSSPCEKIAFFHRGVCCLLRWDQTCERHRGNHSARAPSAPIQKKDHTMFVFLTGRPAHPRQASDNSGSVSSQYPSYHR